MLCIMFSVCMLVWNNESVKIENINKISISYDSVVCVCVCIY